MKFYNQEQFLKNGWIQEVIWVEELGELQHEITKSLRGMLNKEHLIEELADVLICLEQLKLKYNISDEQIQSWIDFKYERNRKRLEQKEEGNIMVSFYRTCRYKNESYIFHCFEQYSNVVGESIAIGGHSAGQISLVFAIIEDRKGNIYRVDPTEIKFTDNKYFDYNCEVMEDDGQRDI